MTTIVPRRSLDGGQLSRQIESSGPFNFAVVDDVLPGPSSADLHHALLAHHGWHYRNWVNQYLHNYDPDIPEVHALARSLVEEYPDVFGALQLVKYWAIMAHRNVGLHPHADNGTVVVNLWLTPDRYNQVPDEGGLVLFDVKRPPDVLHPDYGTSPQAERYIADRTLGRTETVPYRCNRAVVFDARTFHGSQSVNFSGGGAESRRMNMSLLFDDPAEFERRVQRGDEASAAP